MIRVSSRTKRIKYAIRDVIFLAKELEAKGKKVIYLNIGDPARFDFPVPHHIIQALKNAVDEGENWYSSFEGLSELREAICKREKKVNGFGISPENVLITQGVSEGIQMLLSSLMEKGEELLVPGPAYPPYSSYTEFYGGLAIPYKTCEKNAWQPDIDDIRSKINSKTRGLVIINPNNPTGSLYDEQALRKLVDLAGENNLLLISDEIYDGTVSKEKFVSTSSVAKDVAVVGLNGFSKTYSMTGWRLGYIYFHDDYGKLDQLKESIERQARIRLSASTPVQKAGVAALEGPQGHIDEMVKKLRERRDYSWKRLNEINGISCAKPEGAFYTFPKIEEVGSKWKTDKEFTRQLLEKTGILFVHGSGFDSNYGSGHFRAVVLPPIEILENVFGLLDKFMKVV